MVSNTSGITQTTKSSSSSSSPSVTPSCSVNDESKNNNTPSTNTSATIFQPKLTKDEFSVETTIKKLPIKRTEQRPLAGMPPKKLRTPENQNSTSNKEFLFLEQGKAFPCPECHKSFATEVDLKAHLLRHVMQHPFSCPTCGKGFKYEHTLDFHMKSQHGQEAANTPKLNLKSSAKKNATAVATNNSKQKVISDHQEEKPKTSAIKSTTKANKPNQNISINHSLEPNEMQDLKNNNQTQLLKNIKPDQFHLVSVDSTIESPSVGLDLALSGLNASVGVEVKSEKVLIVMLEIANSLIDQTYTLYKCSMCGFSQAKLSLVTEHVQSKHAIQQSPFLCEKCGANFKWQNELLLHEQLHKALDQTNADENHAVGNSNAFKNLLLPPLFQSNLLLMNQYLAASASCMNVSSISTRSSSTLNSVSSTLNQTSPSPPNIQDSNRLISSKIKDPAFCKEASRELLSGSACETSSNALSKQNANTEQSVLSNTFNVELESSCNAGLNLGLSSSASPVSLSSNGSSVSTRSPAGVNETTGSVQRSMLDCDYQCLNLTKKTDRKDPETSSQESLSLRKTSKLMLKELRSKEIDELSKNIAVVKENLSNELGEIEETAPGQFKCRFCEKTFDRIFSVHRHERVHTGFKPCVCKVCGRGFSEKRNLRHHIIRFHSDGSGRELLRRVRKDKANSLDSCEARKQLKLMEMNLLALSGGSGSGGSFHSNQGSDDDDDDDEEDDFMHEETRCHQMAPNCKKPTSSENDCQAAPGSVVRQRTPYEVRNAALREDAEEREKESKGEDRFRSTISRISANGSSSRRRKSLPCKKLLAKYRQKIEPNTVYHQEEREEDDDDDDGDEEEDEEEKSILNDMCEINEERLHLNNDQENEENEQPETLS